MQTKTWAMVAGAGVILLLAAGFVYFKSMQKPAPPAVSENSPVVSEPPQAVEGAKEMMVEAEEFSFTPSEITLTKGEAIKLTFKNSGKFPHDFVIDELGVRTKVVEPGETDTVEFVADKTGTFQFYCNVANHKALGMQGDLEVK